MTGLSTANSTIPMDIDFFGLKRQYQSIKDELLYVVDQVYQTGQVLDGPRVAQFEQEIAQRCNRQYAVAVNSATTGLMFALHCSQLHPDQAIAIPGISFVATLNSALTGDSEVKIADVDANGLINLASLGTLHGANLGAVMYVNLYGNTVDWEKFQLETQFFSKNKLFIIEDAAQSFGASSRDVPSGKMGDISVLSFDPTKNLPNYGSGGMVLTDDQYIAESLISLRDNCKRHDFEYVGYNSKMSESDCAQMSVKLKYFDAWQQRRTKIAEYYTDRLQGHVTTPGTTPGTVHAWHKYVIRLAGRNALADCLQAVGVPTRVHYEKPLYEYPIGYGNGPSPLETLNWEAGRFTSECLSLPIYPELTDAEVEFIATQVLVHV